MKSSPHFNSPEMPYQKISQTQLLHNNTSGRPTGYTRDEAIQKLAISMGMGDFTKTKYSTARFDADTGTLYCNGMIISPNIAKQTVKHFEQVYSHCDLTDPMEKELALMYRCAIESIKLMQHPVIKEALSKLDSEASDTIDFDFDLLAAGQHTI